MAHQRPSAHLLERALTLNLGPCRVLNRLPASCSHVSVHLLGQIAQISVIAISTSGAISRAQAMWCLMWCDVVRRCHRMPSEIVPEIVRMRGAGGFRRGERSRKPWAVSAKVLRRRLAVNERVDVSVMALLLM